MKTAKDLTRQQLEEIVEYAQGFLFLDTNGSQSEEDEPVSVDTESWNPDKEVSGADFIEHMLGILDRHGLVPDPPGRVEG